jgi:hypothetical protein
VSTPGAQQGIAEVCAQPTSVSAHLPASIPTYPGADLRLGQTAGGDGLFGLCTRDAVSAVATFYAAHLPPNGWQQVQNTAVANAQQLSATRGSAHLFITIQPDYQVAGATTIIIQTSGL